MIKALLMVFIGGGMGSILRFILAKNLNDAGENLYFLPIGTMIANVLSCLLLGFLIQKNAGLPLSENTKLLLLTGFCGGFSTFSTFGYEIYLYIQKGEMALGFGYTLASLLLGLLAIFVGIKLA